MVAFRTPVDIGNRGLQHCGAKRINPLRGFAEISRSASEVSFCYEKLREAELNRRTWKFATRRTVLRAIDTDTMLLVPALWVQDTTYFTGSIVADQNGNPWISRIANNVGNDPLSTSVWESYFGPLTVSLFDSGTSYFAGELVYTASGDGTSRTYVSLLSGNEDNPATGTAWDASAVYAKNQVVTYLSVAYMSLIDLNTGQMPSASPAPWAVGTTYATGNTVAGSDGISYSSIGAGNLGNDPTTDGGVNWLAIGATPWTTTFVGGAGSDQWRQIGGAEFPMGVGLTTLNIVYPLGSGPSSQSTTNNVFRLPAGFLRLVPQNPKLGTGALGGPTGSAYDDWLIENDYLITSDGGPIPLRFIADFTDVARMHAMFCEGLAARIGLEVCEPLTQSTAKLGVIAKIYDKWITDAGAVDAIDKGFIDPPEDDLITVRY